jgi:hypothetical protein
MTTKKGVDQRQSNMWSGEEQPERGVIRTLPKKQKRGQQQTQESAESERWWRNATRFAENAWYGETAYLSPKLTREEVWQKSEQWIYDRFHRLGKLVETGISTDQLVASASNCQYVEHRNRSGSKHLPELWLRPGTVEYVRHVKRHGLQVVREQQIAFGRGFTDAIGSHWCGFCSFRARLINAGHALDFPDMSQLYSLPALPDDEPVVGQERWLAFCQTASDVRIETVTHAAEQRKLDASYNKCEAEKESFEQ